MSKSERESLDKTLESLLSTIAKEIEYVEQELKSLYNNWFIETSDDWVIPYIADLLYEKHRFYRLVLRDLLLVLSAWIIKYSPIIDMRITLLSMLAYLADILRYYQDSIANEAHITTAGKEVKVILELPGVRKQNINIRVYGNLLEVTAADLERSRRYHRVIQIPPEADIETGKSTYENGILEITFQKKKKEEGRDDDWKKGIQLNVE
jgi:HSP20 family molecular chaperone IbpA